MQKWLAPLISLVSTDWRRQMGLMRVVLQSPSQEQTWESTSAINKGPWALLSVGFVYWVFQCMCVWWDSSLESARQQTAPTGWTTRPTCCTGLMLPCGERLFTDLRFGTNPSVHASFTKHHKHTSGYHVRFWWQTTDIDVKLQNISPLYIGIAITVKLK